MQIGDKFLCKKSLIMSQTSVFIEGKFYTIKKRIDDFHIDTECDFSIEVTRIFNTKFRDYFYTVRELRRMKLKTLKK